MITAEDLTEQISRLSVSKEALTEFARRLADAFKKALSGRGVNHHAINDGTTHYVGNGFDCCVKASLVSNDDGTWDFRVSEGLGSAPSDYAEQVPHVTAFNDSELSRIAEVWADKVAGISKRIVFQNLYCPKAVELAEVYNDLAIAFRVVRAWDPVKALYILRFDSVFKDLSR